MLDPHTPNPELQQRIETHFHDAARAAAQAAEHLGAPLVTAASLIVNALLDNHRLFACGNGGSASDAEHLVAELVGRLEHERPGLPAIALSANSSVLTALGNDYGYADVFARQIRALGNPGDLLFAISTSGNSENVLQAITAAHEREMRVIALTNEHGGRLAERIGPHDVLITANGSRTLRVQELHRISIHAICDVIDAALLGAP